MGCACLVSNKFTVTSKVDINKGKETKALASKKNCYYFISTSSWVKVLDYLKYKELFEIGKLSSHLKAIAMSQNLLSKFYKNRRGRKSKLISINASVMPNEGKSSLTAHDSINSIVFTPNKNIYKSEINSTLNKSKITILDNVSIGSFKECQSDEINKNKLFLQLKSTTIMTNSTHKTKEESFQKPKIFTNDYNNSDTEIILDSKNKEATFDERLETENLIESASSHGGCSASADSIVTPAFQTSLNSRLNFRISKKDYSTLNNERKYSQDDELNDAISLITLENEESRANSKKVTKQRYSGIVTNFSNSRQHSDVLLKK